MNRNMHGRGRGAQLLAGAAVVLSLSSMAPCARAQEVEEQKPSAAKTAPAPESETTVYLKYVGAQQEANDLQLAVRNIVTRAKVYYDPSANAVLLRGTADELAAAEKIVADLDRPKKVYRLLYSLQTMDGARPGTVQHCAMVATLGQHTQIKLGNRVPLVTGKPDVDGGAASSQVQYVDVGLSISADLSGSGDGLLLRSKIERSGVADERSGVGPQDPLVHQAVLEDASPLLEGKTLTLGALDIPGGTERLEVQVVAEAVK